jgi:hypothetical protein
MPAPFGCSITFQFRYLDGSVGAPPSTSVSGNVTMVLGFDPSQQSPSLCWFSPALGAYVSVVGGSAPKQLRNR